MLLNQEWNPGPQVLESDVLPTNRFTLENNFCSSLLPSWTAKPFQNRACSSWLIIHFFFFPLVSLQMFVAITLSSGECIHFQGKQLLTFSIHLLLSQLGPSLKGL